MKDFLVAALLGLAFALALAMTAGAILGFVFFVEAMAEWMNRA